MNPLFLQYPRCNTSKKAGKWLREHGIDVTSRDITIDNPTREELAEWIARSGLPLRKFFNTSGLKYKELNMKDRIKTATDDELVGLLASDGKLVKRPLLVLPDRVLVGFSEEEWARQLLK
ncbi:MAG: arsenate reductase family protein [Rikenellaceae bacterium]|nr:arsenate reductase family protein [Rikenellaceae bacterium]